jgi:L-amino acid N-acyltransferase YncA
MPIVAYDMYQNHKLYQRSVSWHRVGTTTENLMTLIRSCEEDDLSAIAAIYGEAVRTGTASFELEPPSITEIVRRWRALIDGGYPYLVAEMEDGSVKGYAYAGPYRTRAAYRSSVENSVYVAPCIQGLGIGRQLLDALVDETAARSYRQMIAVIGDSRNIASIRLHAAAGFTHVGILKDVGWKHAVWLDTVLMQRQLGPVPGAPSALAPP